MYLAALIGLRPDWNEIFMFSLLGFGVVMFVLSVLSIVTSIIGCFFAAADKPKSASKKTAGVQKVKDVSEIENPDHAFVVSAAIAAMMPELEADGGGELVAVLSAAAAVALGEECRVVSIKTPDMAYAIQGRQQIYASKNYIPKRAGLKF